MHVTVHKQPHHGRGRRRARRAARGGTEVPSAQAPGRARRRVGRARPPGVGGGRSRRDPKVTFLAGTWWAGHVHRDDHLPIRLPAVASRWAAHSTEEDDQTGVRWQRHLQRDGPDDRHDQAARHPSYRLRRRPDPAAGAARRRAHRDGRPAAPPRPAQAARPGRRTEGVASVRRVGRPPGMSGSGTYRQTVRRVGGDLRSARHLEAYSVSVVAVALTVLNLLGSPSPRLTESVVLACLAFLVLWTTGARGGEAPASLDTVLRNRESFGSFDDLLDGASLATLSKLASSGGVDVRLLPLNPGFSMVVVDPRGRAGRLIVEFHGFRDENIAERMHVMIQRSQSLHWFEYWTGRFEAIWEAAYGQADKQAAGRQRTR